MNVDETTQPSRYRQLFAVLSLIIISIFSIFLSAFPLDYDKLAILGYGGVFTATLLSSVTVILPVPSAIAVLSTARVLDPTIVGILAGTGATIGEFSGYFAGRAGRVIIGEQSEKQQRLENWLKRYGMISIAVLALIPNPFFDITGLIAGSSRYSPFKFALGCWIGKVAKMILLIRIGASFS